MIGFHALVGIGVSKPGVLNEEFMEQGGAGAPVAQNEDGGLSDFGVADAAAQDRFLKQVEKRVPKGRQRSQ